MEHFKKVYHGKRSRVNETEQEMSQEYSEGKNETVSFNFCIYEQKLVDANCQTRDVCQ